MVVFNRPINILCRVSLFLSMALCLLLRLFVFRLLRLKRFSTLTLKVLNLDRKSGSAGMPRPISYAVFCLKKKKLIKEVRDGQWGTTSQSMGPQRLEDGPGT